MGTTPEPVSTVGMAHATRVGQLSADMMILRTTLDIALENDQIPEGVRYLLDDMKVRIHTRLQEMDL